MISNKYGYTEEAEWDGKGGYCGLYRRVTGDFKEVYQYNQQGHKVAGRLNGKKGDVYYWSEWKYT